MPLTPEMEELLDELCAAKGLDKETVLADAGRLAKHFDEVGKKADQEYRERGNSS